MQVSITETGQPQTVCGKLANHLDSTASTVARWKI